MNCLAGPDQTILQQDFVDTTTDISLVFKSLKQAYARPVGGDSLHPSNTREEHG